jgi:ABC-type transport system involved in multi-copper enzyme maturation permease subunit
MSMSVIAAVARQVMREAWRRRTLPALAVLGCGVILSSAFLSFFQLGVEIKFFKDVAMTVIFLFGTMATLVLVSTQLSGEIEARTIYNVLSKPVRRFELVLGKFAGSVAAVGVVTAPMVGILAFFMYTDRGGSVLQAVKAGYLLWLSFVALSAITLAIASFSGSVVCAALSVLVFVASYLKGAVTTYVAILSGSAWAHHPIANPLVPAIGQALYYLLPNFENFNVRSAVVHDTLVPWSYLGRTSLYAAALAALFLYVGVQIFEEREF